VSFGPHTTAVSRGLSTPQSSVKYSLTPLVTLYTPTCVYHRSSNTGPCTGERSCFHLMTSFDLAPD